MLQVFEEYKAGKALLNLNGVDGLEALSIPERVRFFFKESSLGIDRVMGKISFNIHQVDVSKIVSVDRSVNFLRNASVPVTIPAYFNQKVCDWNTYQSKVLQSVLLAAQLHVEAQSFYDWLKDIVKTGKVAKLYQFNITDFDSLVAESREFISALQKSDSLKKPIGELYDSFGKMNEQITRFNLNVKPLKARDVEILDKSFNNIYDIGSLLYRKIEASDIVISSGDLDIIKERIQTIVEALNVTGAMVGLLNELTAVYRSQVAEIQKLK